MIVLHLFKFLNKPSCGTQKPDNSLNLPSLINPRTPTTERLNELLVKILFLYHSYHDTWLRVTLRHDTCRGAWLLCTKHPSASTSTRRHDADWPALLGGGLRFCKICASRQRCTTAPRQKRRAALDYRLMSCSAALERDVAHSLKSRGE
jgi:hypothetical protein